MSNWSGQPQAIRQEITLFPSQLLAVWFTINKILVLPWWACMRSRLVRERCPHQLNMHDCHLWRQLAVQLPSTAEMPYVSRNGVPAIVCRWRIDIVAEGVFVRLLATTHWANYTTLAIFMRQAKHANVLALYISKSSKGNGHCLSFETHPGLWILTSWDNSSMCRTTQW